MDDKEVRSRDIVTIVGYIFILVAAVFFAIWVFKILWPLIEWAEFMGSMGWIGSVDVVELLQYLFLNIYLICAVVIVIPGVILVLIGRKRTK